MNKIELLAPAGNFEKIKFAYLYGADAVYFGGKNYSLRANANNLDLEEIKEACEYAHKLGKKVYVTVNIVFHDDDLKGLKEYLFKLSEYKVDAIIVSDASVIKLVKDEKIPINIHISTQASIYNYETARFYKELGAERIVLARECDKENIERIKKETGLELECFLHGAMCVSFSGRCVMSNYCTNRDSNRGGCAQICRWIFDYYQDGDKVSSEFSMTPKDLNMIKYIKEMIECGVNSFKIEGRMRSIYYVSTVISTYRNIIDKLYDGSLTDRDINYAIKILNRVANRESVPQFFDKLPGVNEQYYLGRKEESNQDFLGLVLENNDGMVTLEQRNYFKVGDVTEIFGPNHDVITYKINEIYNEKDELIEEANHPQMIVKLKIDEKIEKNDMMRIKMFDF